MHLLFAEDQPQLRRSAREYALLEYLIRNKGIILSREQIENNLWNYDYAGGTNVVDVYISYLRKKLDGGHEKKLLHITRLEQGTQKLQLETADLSQLVDERTLAGEMGTTVGGTGLSKEELAARGMNHSSLHEDVMIGAEDSRITGKCRDGRTVPLFENGVWVL